VKEGVPRRRTLRGGTARNRMEKVRDERYPYEALGTTAWCDLQVYRAEDGAVLALCAERADNPGPSITSWAAPLAEAVWRQAGAPPVFTWIEHYPPSRDGTGETFALVQFQQTPTGAFTAPHWRQVARLAIMALLEQTTLGDAVAEWTSIPPPNLQLDCATCGQPLAVSEVLAGARICAACSAGERMVGGMREAGADLDQARAAWLTRTNAHVARLTLTRAQQARLFAALLGERSLWALSPAELYALIAQVEQFPHAAAVEAFLDTQPPDPGRPS
jgi:hypothetical protein